MKERFNIIAVLDFLKFRYSLIKNARPVQTGINLQLAWDGNLFYSSLVTMNLEWSLDNIFRSSSHHAGRKNVRWITLFHSKLADEAKVPFRCQKIVELTLANIQSIEDASLGVSRSFDAHFARFFAKIASSNATSDA